VEILISLIGTVLMLFVLRRYYADAANSSEAAAGNAATSVP